MSVADEEAYVVLNKFVDGFFPDRWVTREGDDVLDEDGEPTVEARLINTKALVEYQSYGQAVELLGFLLTLLIAFFFVFFDVANPSTFPLQVTRQNVERGC